MDITQKHKSHAFGKDVYFLGTLRGVPQWLEEPTWDCERYWGCGYIEEYTRPTLPAASRDISSHTHTLTDNLKTSNSTVKNNVLKDLDSKPLTSQKVSGGHCPICSLLCTP